MNTFLKPLYYLAAIFLAGALQQGLGTRLAIYGHIPDFYLALFCPICIYLKTPQAMLFGFAIGIFRGGLAGVNLTHYVTASVVTGCLLAQASRLDVEIRPLMAGIFCFLGSLVYQFILVFFAPPNILTDQIYNALGCSLYNAVLSVIIYFFIRKRTRTRPAWG